MRPGPVRRLGALLACAWPLLAGAQAPLPPPARPAAPPDGAAGRADCPKAADAGQRHLLGLWHAEFEGLPRGATLLLERHPAYGESVAGAINRDGEKAQVAGDVEDGEFTLEESTDGVGIAATWVGAVVEDSCAREIRGDWQAAGERIARPFLLRKRD